MQKVQLAPEKAAKLLQTALQCITETGADPALLVQIRNRKYTDDEKVKKFFLCAFKQTGIASKKGVVKVEKLLDIYPENANKDALKTVIEGCNKDNGEEPMDKLFNFFKCFQEKTPVRLSLM